jgi:ATP-binding cassette subfamily F protein 3
MHSSSVSFSAVQRTTPFFRAAPVERRRRHFVVSASSAVDAPQPQKKKKGKKGLKKNKANTATSNSPVVQKAVAEVNEKNAKDVPLVAAEDEVNIPYGDASGAALLLNDVFLAVADTDLLQEANAQVMSGQKIGLVGGNGCGKSTLLKCIAGVRSIQDGEIIINSKLNVGYFEQTAVSGSTKTVYEEARARMTRLNKAEAALREAERVCESENCDDYCEAADVLMDCYAEFEAAGGNDAEKRIAAVLDGLGFSRKQWDFTCDNLSGGWQMRVALARLLLSPAGSEENGLLLLDEPTNHLDEISKKWLADWIKKSPNTTIIVSHEESLLDGACSHIMEVRAKGLHWYVGNYSKFLQDRDERVRVAQASYNKLAAEAADLKDFVARFSANASKAAQASSRAKLLIKVEAEMRKLEREAAANFSEGEAGDSTKMALRLSKPPPSDQDVLMMDNAVGIQERVADFEKQGRERVQALSRNARGCSRSKRGG